MPKRLADLRCKPFLMSLSADYFCQFLEKSISTGRRHLLVSDVEITGVVDLSLKALPKGLCVERVYFRDALKMHNCTFGGHVSFTDCAFDKTFDLGHAAFENCLSFQGCSFGIEDTNLAGTVLRLDGTTISGDLSFIDIQVHGCISANRITAARIEFAACRIDGVSDNAAAILDLSSCSVVGSIIFEIFLQSIAGHPRIGSAPLTQKICCHGQLLSTE